MSIMRPFFLIYLFSRTPNHFSHGSQNSHQQRPCVEIAENEEPKDLPVHLNFQGFLIFAGVSIKKGCYAERHKTL